MDNKTASQDLLDQLKEQIEAGFKICNYYYEDNKHYFPIPALEHEYLICVPDSTEVQEFLSTKEYEDAIMLPKKYCVVLLDIIGFSKNDDDTQLKLIVRYQCEIRRALKSIIYEKLISIGDGTIIIIPESEIPYLAYYLNAIDHSISGYNLDFKHISGIEINIRIGVHIGKAYMFNDINKEVNYIGNGINVAQRISTFVPDLNNLSIPLYEKSNIYLSKNAYIEMKPFCNDIDYLIHNVGLRSDKHGNNYDCYAFHKITNS